MAVYTGKVNLINMSNITATVGNGIQETQILYAVSENGVAPPDLVDAELKVTDGQILTFADTGSTFHIQNGKLWIKQNGIISYLNLEDSYITGILGEDNWSKFYPEVPQGKYLWTKTIYIYTNGTKTITYSVYRQGMDGSKGDPGPMGESSSTYKINCEQTEILKFAEEGNKISISPATLSFSITKEDPANPQGQVQVNNLSKDYLVLELYTPKDGKWYTLDKTNIVTLTESNVFRVSLQRIVDEDDLIDGEVAYCFQTQECILKISYTYLQTEEEETKRFNLVEFLNIRHGMSKDMASLDLNAADLVAAMGPTKLVFGGHGLTIENGAFEIRDTHEDGSYTQLLYSDELGNLAVKGNIYADSGYFKGDITGASGTFSGVIQAESGYFKGDITGATGTFSGVIKAAAGGEIGGFNIGETQLISSSIANDGTPNVILDGKNGKITAKNILLGTGAEIEEYISLGEQVQIKKAESDSDSFITVSKENNEILSLKANGTMNIGYGENSITISGADGSITSQNYDRGLGWKISNTNSIFNDVTVRGSIRASVLEYGETQAIGGALLIRPSTRILSAQVNGTAGTTTLIVEETKGFNVNDYCRIDTKTSDSIGYKFYKILEIQVTQKIIKVEGEVADCQGKPLVSFGQINDNVGISINGSIDNSFSTPQSISVFEFDQNTKAISSKIILGKLPDIKDIYGYAAGTYGLYAENVLLKGSLVTQSRTEDGNKTIYSGISTLYSEDGSPHSRNTEAGINFSNPGEILLWAGAPGDSKEEVEKSSFFVDKNGNLFAGSGYFKGTIITDATISASAIETAIIRGTGDKPALTIEDTKKGIHFTTFENNLLSLIFDDWKTETYEDNLALVTKEKISILPKTRYYLSFGEKVSKIVLTYYLSAGGEPIFISTVEGLWDDFVSFETPENVDCVEIKVIKYATLEEYRLNFNQLLVPALKKYKTVFEVTDTSITANVPNFVFNSNFTVGDNGSLVVPNLYIIGSDAGNARTLNSAVMFDRHRISYTDNFNQAELTGIQKGYIDFENGLKFSSNGENEVMELSNQEVRIKGENTSLFLEYSIKYGGDNIEYKPVRDKDGKLIGYDLYVE